MPHSHTADQSVRHKEEKQNTDSHTMKETSKVNKLSLPQQDVCKTTKKGTKNYTRKQIPNTKLQQRMGAITINKH